MQDFGGIPVEEIGIPVGRTALYTCAERAVESGREDRLFYDPGAKV
jgi:O-methyltransferase involved in polyketide biosynthesis